MYKVLAVLLAMFALTSGNKPAYADNAKLQAQVPTIVAQVALMEQDAAIPTTILFKPKTSGLYRISAYLAMTMPGTAGRPWSLIIGWTDDGGPEVLVRP